MAAPKVELGWDNSMLQAGAAKAQVILAGFATKARSTLGKAMSADVVGGFGQLTAAVGSVAGLRELLNSFDRFDDLSIQLNMSVESLQRLGLAAKLSGSDVETLAKGMSKLTRSLAEAESSEKTGEALRELGISASQLRRLSVEEQVVALSDAFITARARGEGFAEVFDLMGRNGAELIPLLMQGREQLEALADAPVLSKDQVQRLSDFNDKLDEGLAKMKAWTAGSLLEISDLAAVAGLTLFGDLDGSFVERLDQAAEALARSRVEAEAAAAEQERQNQAAREAADWAKKIAEAQKAAADSIEKGQKELEAQEKRLKSIREQISQAKDANLKQQLSPEENLEMARGQAASVEAKIKEARDAAYMEGNGGEDTEEILRLELQRQQILGDIIALEQQIAAEKERQQKADQERADSQRQSASDLAGELQVLQLRAAGRNREADALERQQRIQAEAQRIVEQTGMAQEQARRVAEERARLEEKISGQQESGRKRIQGYSAGTQGNAEDARARAAQRMEDARARVQSSYDRFMPGLGGRDSPLAQRAAQNSAETPSPDSANPQAAQIVAQVLPQILAALQ
jgi:hypothetical protein